MDKGWVETRKERGQGRLEWRAGSVMWVAMKKVKDTEKMESI